MAQKGGPRLRGQRLLDNAPCQAAVNLGSSALLFPRHRALLVQHRPDRHAKGSPFGRAGERSETERASPGQKSFCAAISRFFVRAILSLCKSCLAASLPSPSPSVTLPGLRLPASASLSLASCWPRPQQLLPVSAAGGGRRRCSQRERLWQAGPLPTGRRRPDMAQEGGPCLRGQRLLDNAPCQATVNLGSSALLFPRYCALLVQHRPDRHAKGSPSGRAGA